MNQNSRTKHRFGYVSVAMVAMLLFCSEILSAGNVIVTFRVNMSKVYPINKVYIGSDWAGWSFNNFQAMSDDNHDSIFELSVFLPSGASYNYRYTLSNTNWDNFETMVGTMCGSGGANADRNIIVPNVNTVLDVVCFNSCTDCDKGLGAGLHLSVDMTDVAVSPNGVHVAGSFNNWLPDSLELTDADNDHIYETTIQVLQNQSYEYKFLNGNLLSDAEVVFGTCEFRSKRRISVLNDTLEVPVVKFGSCNSTGAPVEGIKIACIGNSITEGGAGNYFNSWPIQLRDLLGSEYYTENLGVSGTTMSKVGDSPWWNQPQYGYTFALNPNIVLIKLGTNDSKGGNWKPDHYKTDYIDLIDKIRAMSSKPVIYMVTPAKAFSSAYGINDNTIYNKLIPILHQIAFEKGVNLIDMYNATITQSANFPDGIHPNAAGALVIAQKAYENILKAKPVISQIAVVTDTTTNDQYKWFYNDVPMDNSNHRSINVSKSGKYQVVAKMSHFSSDIYLSEPFQLDIPSGTTQVGLTTDYDVVYKVNNTWVSDQVRIYPNPANNCIRIENADLADVTIFNDMGVNLLTQKQIENGQIIDLPNFRNGVYYVQLTRDHTTITKKIIILNN